MKDQLISFETAKLAKKKGFDIPVPRYYRADGKFITNFEKSNGEGEYHFDPDDFDENWNDGRLVDKNNGSCWECSVGSSYLEVYSAPTQSLIQKWLREEKYKYISIHIALFTKKFSVGKIICGTILHDGREYLGSYHGPFKKKFDTYEEALEYALLEVLKLI